MYELCIPEVLSLYKLWETKPPVPLILKAGLQVEVSAREEPKERAEPLDPETQHKMATLALQGMNL